MTSISLNVRLFLLAPVLLAGTAVASANSVTMTPLSHVAGSPVIVNPIPHVAGSPVIVNPIPHFVSVA